MRTIILSAFALALATGGCEGPAEKLTDPPRHRDVPADNTDMNQRDRDPATVTPFDQGESEVDRTITQTIRQEVVKDAALSTNAKNIKIITVDGVVTLRGPVKSVQEKTDIGALAQRVVGTGRVDNQLEVAAN